MDKDATQTEKLTATKKKLEKQLSLAEQRTKLLREEYENQLKKLGSIQSNHKSFTNACWNQKQVKINYDLH